MVSHPSLAGDESLSTAVSVVTVRCTGLHSDSDYEMKGVEEMFGCVLTVCLAFTGGL